MKTWKLQENTYSVAELSEVYSEPSRTTKIDHFVEINKSFKPLTGFLIRRQFCLTVTNLLNHFALFPLHHRCFQERHQRISKPKNISYIFSVAYSLLFFVLLLPTNTLLHHQNVLSLMNYLLYFKTFQFYVQQYLHIFLF